MRTQAHRRPHRSRLCPSVCPAHVLTAVTMLRTSQRYLTHLFWARESWWTCKHRLRHRQLRSGILMRWRRYALRRKISVMVTARSCPRSWAATTRQRQTPSGRLRGTTHHLGLKGHLLAVLHVILHVLVTRAIFPFSVSFLAMHFQGVLGGVLSRLSVRSICVQCSEFAGGALLSALDVIFSIFLRPNPVLN